MITINCPKKFFWSYLLVLFFSYCTGQTLIDPNGGGGFETGNTFPANNWTAVQPGTSRHWQVGTVAGSQSGNNAAYIGAFNNYNGSNNNSLQHFYRDVSIPSGATNIVLSFYLKMPTIDSHATIPFYYDFLKVYTTTTSNTPSSSIVPSSGYNQVFAYEKPALLNFELQTITLPNSLAGTTVRLVFTFISDGLSPHANPAIDNISLTFTPANDAGITALASPICSGTQNVVATIKNYGTSTLTSATINWSVNGTAQAPYSWVGSLAKDATADVTVGTYNFSSGTNYSMIASTSLPNGVTDNYTANDSFTSTNFQTNVVPADVDITNNNAVVCKNTVQTLTATGGMVTGATVTVNSGTVNKPIPDNSATGVSQDLLVSGIPAGATITKVEVKFNINHSYAGDVEVNLRAPNGKIVNLVADRGASGKNFTNTIVTSNTSAASFSTGAAPFTGVFRADLAPSSSLIGTVNTQNFSDLFSIINGNWTVLAYDDASLDIGTLLDCSITITYNLPSIISWTSSPSSPNTIFTDLACTTPYVAGTNASTVYVKPSVSTTYIATSSLGTCSKSDAVTYSMETAVWGGSSWSYQPSGNRSIEFQGDYVSNGSGVNLQGCSCTVTSGNVIISSGDRLTLQDEIKVNGGSITFENNSALFQTNNIVNTGNITLKRDAKLKRLDYVYWSSPVTGQNLKLFSPNTLNNRFYTYNESNDSFTTIDPTVNSFQNGTGYAIRSSNYASSSPTTFTFSFNGVPNNGNITIPLAYSGATKGYNLVGNPYPSDLDLDKLYNYNIGDITGTFYFWTNINPNPSMQGSNYPTSGYYNNYAVYNLSGGIPAAAASKCLSGASNCSADSPVPTGIVKPGQGFLVKASGSGKYLDFKNDQRSYSSNASFFNNYRMANTTPDRYWIQLITPLQLVNTILIAYREGSSLAYEESFDAELLVESPDSFYTKLDDSKFIIQGRGFPLDLDDKIDLGTAFYQNGTHVISIANKEGIFADNQPIYLHDKLLGVYTNLQNESYSFTAQQGIDENRFEIVYKPSSTLGTDVHSKKNLLVYQMDEMIIIESPENINTVIISDASGRVVHQAVVSGKSTKINASKLVSGLYYVTVESINGRSTKKIIKK